MKGKNNFIETSNYLATVTITSVPYIQEISKKI